MSMKTISLRQTPCSRRIWYSRVFATTAAVLIAGFASFGASDARGADAKNSPQTAEDRPVMGIEHRGPIKVVFQVTADEMKGGVGKGLFYLRKIHEAYLAAGVDPDQLDLHAVYHGEASDHLLTDQAWNRVRKETGGNPNTAVIAELVERGVSVELCDTRRVANGWAKSDVHADVKLVSGAYHRIIDLQHRGYAYVKF